MFLNQAGRNHLMGCHFAISVSRCFHHSVLRPLEPMMIGCDKSRRRFAATYLKGVPMANGEYDKRQGRVPIAATRWLSPLTRE